MPSSDVIVISDDSDTEHRPNNAGYTSDDSEVVVISISSSPPEPPASTPPRAWGNGSEIWDRSDVEDDDDNSDMDFVDAGGLINASQSQKESTSASQRSGVASGSSSRYRSSASTTPESRKRKSPTYSFEASGSDSDDIFTVEAPKKPAKTRKKSEEEKVLEKAEKEAQKLLKKEEAKRKKEAAAAGKAAQKLANKAHKDANKLVFDKKKTLADMTVELSPDLISSPLYAPLSDKMQEFECALKPIADSVVGNSVTGLPTDLKALDVRLIRWKRRIAATYDERAREWFPLAKAERYTRTEGTYLIYVTGKDVMRSFVRNLPLGNVPSISQQVGALRTALGPKHHIHLMLCGWKSVRKSQEIKEKVERELVGLQVREGLFVEQVKDEDEAVNWIYNMSADLGIKPHKLIERSHLPFCALASSAFQVGKSDEDTMVKMLAQLPRLTDPAAKAIVEEYGTINRLMEAYEKAEGGGGGAMVLANVVIPRTKSGKNAPRVLNKALSERLYGVLWGSDPKALIN